MNTPLILPNDNLQPRDEIRIVSIDASPYPDRRRVRVNISTTPFRERPNLEITIRDAAGSLTASTSAIEIMSFRVSFNLHLRGAPDPAGVYTVTVVLYYDDLNTPQDSREAALHIPPVGA